MPRKQRGMKRLTKLSVAYVHEMFKHWPKDCTRPHNLQIREGLTVRLNRKYLKLFAKKGTTCVSCGAEGVFYAVETHKHQDRPHLNLYTADEALMTKDHIKPKSKGGGNNLANLQPMCMHCNCKKGAKYEEGAAPVPKIQRARGPILTHQLRDCRGVWSTKRRRLPRLVLQSNRLNERNAGNGFRGDSRN